MSKKQAKKAAKPRKPSSKAKNKAGAPTSYTQDIADALCLEISTSSKGLRSICAIVGIAPSSVFKWLNENKSFSEQYARAKQEQADMMVEEIQEVADEAMKLSKRGVSSFRLGGLTAAARLKIDALKWTASKLKPKKYGDKLDLTSDNKQIKANILWLGGKQPFKADDE